MGQRHHTLIRYRNREVKDNDEINICTIHNQNGYGRLPIYALGKIAMFNKHNTSTKKEARNFKSLTDDTCCYMDKIETILSLISTDYIDGLSSDYRRYADVHTPEQFGQPADLHPDTLPELIRTASRFIFGQF